MGELQVQVPSWYLSEILIEDEMLSVWSKLLMCALAGLTAAHRPLSSSRSCNVTQIQGCNATGEIKTVNGGKLNNSVVWMSASS